jgi:threonylcarbamoyladenosine tRNA methylthiotransferase MtaB
MPQLSREVVKARAARLREAAAERRSRWLCSLVGSHQPVLIEAGGKGHADNFAPIIAKGAVRGEIGLTRIVGLEEDHLTAVWA